MQGITNNMGVTSGFTSQEGGMMPMIALPVREDQLLIKSHGSMTGSLYQTQTNPLPQLNMSMMEESKPQQTHNNVDIQKLQEQIRNLSDLFKLLQKQSDINE
jgi:hypothetical protein